MGAVVTIKKAKTDDMLTLKEAAVMLGAGYSTVSKWVALGKIPACKIKGSKAYYISLDDLNEFEKYGNLRTRQKVKPAKPKTSVDILETMSKTQQTLLLEAIAASSRLLAMTTNQDQIGLIKSCLDNVINNPAFLASIVNGAPEIMEEDYGRYQCS